MRREPFKLSVRPASAEPETGTDGLDCKRCLQRRPADELDRMLWCEACREAERRVAAIWGRGVGILAGLGLALWIALVVQPSNGPFLVLWAATILVTYRVGARLGRELIYGAIRVRNVPGARAEPSGEA